MNNISKLIIIITLFFISVNFVLFGQDMLSNPSFEISGEGNNNFGGWDQFGAAGTSFDAYHGSMAASVSGQNNGSTNLSGYWQQHDCEPGEQLEISGHVKTSLTSPLLGDCAALINVEWRDANDELIDYDSFTVADASTSTAQYIEFNLLSSPAPSNTEAIHLLLGVLQIQNQPAPSVNFDQITLYSTTYPTIDDMQWDDFPSGRTIEFSGWTWRVKGSGWYGPGPNNFSHLPESIWVDDIDRLHLTIKSIENNWFSSEATLVDTLGYGDYIFTTIGTLDQLDIHAVLGLFLWQYGPSWDPSNMWWNPYNEIDVEFSRWGNAGNEIGQFVAQPWDWTGNLVRFDAVFGVGELSSHAFNWLPDRVEFRSWYGGIEDELPQNMIFEWIYTGPHIPRPEQPRVHVNLWHVSGTPSTDQEVIIEEFNFLSAGGITGTKDDIIETKSFKLQPNYPNPFNPETNIRYSLTEDSDVSINIYNLKGQIVKTLVYDRMKAGEYSIIWNGTNDENEPVVSGIYFYQMKTNATLEVRRCLLLK